MGMMKRFKFILNQSEHRYERRNGWPAALTLHGDPGQGAGAAHRAEGVAEVLAPVPRGQAIQHQAVGPRPPGRQDVAQVHVQVEPVWGHHNTTC